MKTLIDELRKYKPTMPNDDHMADAIRYAFISQKIESKKARTPWVKIVILIMAILIILWLTSLG